MVDVYRSILDDAKLTERLVKHGYCYVAPTGVRMEFPDVVKELGPLIPQYAGELVRDIRPDPAFSNATPSAYNTAELTPHTEWYESPGLPPRYVALWGVHASEGPGGETTLADGYGLLRHFSEEDRKRFMKVSYEWRLPARRTPENVELAATSPILQRHGGVDVLRFSTNDLRVSDELSAEYVRVGVRYFRENCVAVKVQKGGLLVWDNWRMLHSRTAFEDKRRHLRRVLIAAE